MTPSPAVRATSSYAELSREIRGAGLLRRRHAYYWSRIGGMVAAFIATVAAIVVLGDSWFQLIVAAVLAVVVTQFGFLGHDAAHRQMFRSGPWNEWTARILSGAFAGLSYGWWSHKHNRHHAAPNQEGTDPDIGRGLLIFNPRFAAGRLTGLSGWFTRHQGYLFFPILLLEGVNLHLSGVQTLLRRRDLPHRRLELTIVVTRMTAYVALLLVVLPVGKAAAFLAVQLGLFGLLLGAAFAPNHKGMPIVAKDAGVDFLRRQVLMSRNVTGGPVTDFMMGGLNYQIEHHLFPNMPRPALRLARPVVEEFCRREGVTYTSTSLLGSYAIVVAYLNSVDTRLTEPFDCPVVARFRD